MDNNNNNCCESAEAKCCAVNCRCALCRIYHRYSKCGRPSLNVMCCNGRWWKSPMKPQSKSITTCCVDNSNTNNNNKAISCCENNNNNSNKAISCCENNNNNSSKAISCCAGNSNTNNNYNSCNNDYSNEDYNNDSYYNNNNYGNSNSNYNYSNGNDNNNSKGTCCPSGSQASSRRNPRSSSCGPPCPKTYPAPCPVLLCQKNRCQVNPSKCCSKTITTTECGCNIPCCGPRARPCAKTVSCCPVEKPKVCRCTYTPTYKCSSKPYPLTCCAQNNACQTTQTNLNNRCNNNNNNGGSSNNNNDQASFCSDGSRDADDGKKQNNFLLSETSVGEALKKLFLMLGTPPYH